MNSLPDILKFESDGVILFDNKTSFNPGESRLIELLFSKSDPCIKENTVFFMREGRNILGIVQVMEVLGQTNYKRPIIEPSYDDLIAWARRALKSGINKDTIMFVTELSDIDVENLAIKLKERK